MDEPSDQEIEDAFHTVRGIPGSSQEPVPPESGRSAGDFSIRTKAGKAEADRATPAVQSANAPGWTCAEEALVRAFGSDKAREIMSRSIPRIGRIWLSFLEELQPRQLSVLFARESLEVKALVIAHASPEVGSRIIGYSALEEQKLLVRRLARMREVPSSIVRTIADSLKERIRTLGTDAEREIEGVSALAEIMKHLEDDTLLKSIEEELPGLGQALSDELYSIEMVHRVRSRTLEDILTRLDDIEIARLLKGKEESVRRRILEHVSENRALIISEEYRDLGPQLRSDVDALTHQFVLMLREADPDAETAIPQT
jgi:flagellar motor switch protein FliG